MSQMKLAAPAIVKQMQSILPPRFNKPALFGIQWTNLCRAQVILIISY